MENVHRIITVYLNVIVYTVDSIYLDLAYLE